MNRFWIFFLLLPLSQARADLSGQALEAEQWASPRHGETIASMAPVAEMVRAWRQAPTSMIGVHYPANEQGGVWAEELRSWLIALGVASAHITLVPDAPQEDRLELTIMQGVEEVE